LTQEWTVTSPAAREALRRKAEEHASDNAGPKMIQVSLSLDHLLITVADVAKDMRDEGTKTIQASSMTLVGGSFFIAALNLFLGKRRKPVDGASDEAEDRPSGTDNLEHLGKSPAPPIPSETH
ncbi:MAG: hypothetical protein IT389_09510, partial [Nitrospira sp.]|nr:hypothetical protein [Nitrospira sp.]